MIRVIDRSHVVVVPDNTDVVAYMERNRASVYSAFIKGLREALRTDRTRVIIVVHRQNAFGVSKPLFKPMLESAMACMTRHERYEEAADARDLLRCL